jgi:flagellar basal-body rod modification protein FlgD
MVTSVNNTTGAGSGAQELKSATEKSFVQNFDTFLKLLTVQLQNQDPLSPLDTNQFTQQIATFSQVEQAISSNKKLDQLISQTQNSEISNSVNYVGKSVEMKSADMVIGTTGQKSFGYELDKDADSVGITVKNDKGVVVYDGEGIKDKGRHDVSWDRLDGNGNYLPPGKYSVTVSAKYKGASDPVNVTTFTNGVISGVNMDSSGVSSLSVDGQLDIPIDDVEFVGLTPAANNNAAPVVTNFAGELNYNSGQLFLDDDITLLDKDNDVLQGAVIAIENLKNGTSEKLNVTLEEGISIESYKDGILVLSGVATKESYEHVLRSLNYENTAASPNTETRRISILTSDGMNTSNKVTKTIKYNS